jgi:hypothetical protein
MNKKKQTETVYYVTRYLSPMNSFPVRKFILQEWISIDGFAADREGGIEFFHRP